MSAIPTVIAPKLSRLIPLLASDRDGEVVATARAIGRTLKQAGADFHDLAAAVCSAGPLPVEEVPLRWRDIPASERAAWLIEMRTSSRLSPWEQDFCSSILAQVRFRPWSELSAKQVGVLDRCVGKIAEGP